MSFLSYLACGLLSRHLEILSPYKKLLCQFEIITLVNAK